MPFRIYDAAIPVFDATLADVSGLLDKALAEGVDEAALMQARLAPDMLPFPKQVQLVCDLANRGAARLAGVEAPSFPDTEANFSELKTRIARTREVIAAIDPSAFEGAEDRQIEFLQRDGSGWRWTGAQFLTQSALPNLLFHATTAYALLRAHGVPLGKADFLKHRGAPTIAASEARRGSQKA